jgi:hypothetical protein
MRVAISAFHLPTLELLRSAAMTSRLIAAGFVLAAFSFAVSNAHAADGRLGTKASSRSVRRSASLTTALHLPHLPGKAQATAPVKPLAKLHLPTAAQSGSGVFQLVPERETQSSGQKVFTLLPPPQPPAELMQFTDDKPKPDTDIIILSASETSNPEAYILQFDE